MPGRIDVSGYLSRLGVTAAQPGVEALHELHRAHAERVPYEVLEIHLGRSTTVCPRDSMRRIVAGRGGYCYHVNGAFSLLLRELGYRVTRHAGGVQGHADEPGVTGNHLVLTVSGLPSAQSPSGRWLVDLGMGDGLHGPLPLVTGEYTQGPFRYALRPSEVAVGGWRFDHDPAGSFKGMDFRAEPARMSGFAARHAEMSTSPDSTFVRTLVVARRDATGADVLRGLMLKRIGAAPAETELTTRDDYFGALRDVFGLTFDAAERAVLWPRVSAAYREWKSRTAL